MAFDIFQYFWCGCFVIWKRNHLSIILLECMYLISFSPIFYPQRVPIFFGYCFHNVIKLLRIRSSLCTLPSWRSVSFTIIWLFSIDTTSNWKTTDTRAVGWRQTVCLNLSNAWPWSEIIEWPPPLAPLFYKRNSLSIILHVRAKYRRVSVRHTYSTCLAAVGRHKNLLFGREKIALRSIV